MNRNKIVSIEALKHIFGKKYFADYFDFNLNTDFV